MKTIGEIPVSENGLLPSLHLFKVNNGNARTVCEIFSK